MTKLKQMLKKRKMKNKELAKKAGVVPQTVSLQCISGIKALRVAKRYAKILNCDPLELLG